MNQNNNPEQQKRVIYAVVLSFLFFLVYSEFFMPKKHLAEQNVSNNASIATDTTTQQIQANQAPVVNNQTQNISPSQGVVQGSRIIAKIQSEHFEAQIDHLGRISSFLLKDKKYTDKDGKNINVISDYDKDGKKIEPPNSNRTLPLELRFSDPTLNQKASHTDYLSDKDELFVDENGSARLSLTQNLGDLIVKKELIFYPKGNYDIEVSLSKNATYFITPGLRPGIVVDSYVVHGALVLDKEDVIHTFEDGDVKEEESLGQVVLASGFDRYYTSFFYNFNEGLDVFVTKDLHGNSLIFVRSDNEFKSGAYIGAKEHSILRAIDKRLEKVVEYGWFTFIAKPMYSFLEFLHTYIGNWGWAIVVLTLIVRLILFPLTYKSMISMNKLKDLAPKMKELREKYKGDPQKMNMQMMELYKKHGANPFSGCLPILLQIPIFFAIYRVLLNAAELKSAPWAFWIHDLSVMDPYFILPIFMGATMFLQQLITPMAIQDPIQAKVLKFLPVVFTFFFLFFPAGLTLYWCINNICSLIQQWVINKMFAKEHHKKEAEQAK